MYFPYLRARQFELIALKDLVSNDEIRNIIPVLEPVKADFNNLNLAHKTFKSKNFGAFLIVNPFEGEVKGDSEHYFDYISNPEISNYLPAFHYSNNENYIISSIEKYNLKECLIICLGNLSNEDGFKRVCNNPKVTSIMLLSPEKYRVLDNFIKSLEKFYIRLDDVFEKKKTNAEFLPIAAHKFTEEHLYYLKNGYQGFGDFATLPRDYVDGGGTPLAVAIHLTYLNNQSEGQIWIRHFTSETNGDKANVQGKFAEAVAKAVQVCKSLPLNNSATHELERYYSEMKYPGLGTVKKISIKNHLLIITGVLS